MLRHDSGICSSIPQCAPNSGFHGEGALQLQRMYSFTCRTRSPTAFWLLLPSVLRPVLLLLQRKRLAETKKAAEERELAARLAYEARTEAEEEEAQRVAAKAALKAFLLK